MKCLHSPFFVYKPFFSAQAIRDQYSNNHNLVDELLSDLSVKFGQKAIIAIPKNRKHQEKGTPGASVVDKPYSVTTLSKVLIRELDYVYFHYIDNKGTKEIEIEKEFNVPIRFSNSSQPEPNCSILNLKFDPNNNKLHHKGTFVITIRLYTHYTIDNVPANQSIFYKNFQRAEGGGYDHTKCFHDPAKNNFLDVHPTPFTKYTMCTINGWYCYQFGTNPQPLPQILPQVRGPIIAANQYQLWAPPKQQPQAQGPKQRNLQYSSANAKCKKIPKQKSMFEKGIQGQIAVQL